MAIALTAPASVEIGNAINFQVAGATASGNVDVAISSEEDNGGLAVSAVVAASAGGAYDSTGVLDCSPNEEGHVNITVTDVTGGTTDTARVEVFRSAN